MNRAMREFEELSATIDAIAVHVERYEIFEDDLRRVRAEQAQLLHAHPSMRTGLGDMEAELSYLRARALRPRTVVQVGCRDGWSTSWLLRALRDNGGGELHSFDLTDAARRHVPAGLSDGRWHFTAGDVRAQTRRLPRGTDYLFLDASGSARFAKWYLPNLVAPLAPGTPVSVGGVAKHRIPVPFSGAALILGWLGHGRLDHFTAAPAREAVIHRQIERVRRSMGFNAIFDSRRCNPMVFFETA